MATKAERKKAEAAEREKRLRRAFVLPREPRFGEIRLRPFSLWTLDFCDELGLGFFVDPARNSDPPPVQLTRPEQLSALVWGHDVRVSPDAIDEHLFHSTWPIAIKAYHRQPDVGQAIGEIAQYIGYIATLIDAASVRIRPRKRKQGEKREKDPADLLSPSGRCALIWSVSGGQILTEEQHDYLYRRMPLPVLLQYYHAACREAQLLTVAPSRRKPKLLKKALDRVRKPKREAEGSPPPVDFL